MSLQLGIIGLVWLAILGALGWMLHDYLARLQTRRRVWSDVSQAAGNELNVDPAGHNALAQWLFRAGYRRPGAAAAFVALNLLAFVVGLTVALAMRKSGLLPSAERAALSLPGGIGSLAQPILRLAPVILIFLLVALPATVVRAARRRRIESVEQDLPLTLELLATLAESGISFDAGVDRILASRPAELPLSVELRTFQAELLSGRSRVECLRRVARRLDVTSVTIFISAVVQAEQIGSGMAAVLRRQADDLRQRRRERALELSMALPVKQMFPLVICFLPGILVFAIGPLFAEFMKYSNTFGRMGH